MRGPALGLGNHCGDQFFGALSLAGPNATLDDTEKRLSRDFGVISHGYMVFQHAAIRGLVRGFTGWLEVAARCRPRLERAVGIGRR